MRLREVVLAVSLSVAVPPLVASPDDTPRPAARNIVLFVADGLRAGIVDKKTAPNLQRLRLTGVYFTNTHSLFPTLTTPNASGLATGHYLGDTGDFGNVIYTGFAVPSAGNSVTPFLENDAVLGEVDKHFKGNYLNEESVLAAAQASGMLTAAIGKLGPVAIQNLVQRSDNPTIIIDDATGRDGGLPLSDKVKDGLTQAGIALQAPGRGKNADTGDANTPGTTQANIVQQQYFVDVTTRVVLPQFKESGKPFMLVFWSRDPDGSQHNQGDSLGKLVPGINGPTSMAGIRNANDNFAAIWAKLKDLGLDRNTDIFVTADHGFSTISKESRTSYAATQHYVDVPAGQVPAGFLALDLAHALSKPLFDPDAGGQQVDVAAGKHTNRGNGLLGDATKPEVVIAANGGSDLVYLPGPDAAELAPAIVSVLLKQDYVSGIFVDERLGTIPGTLPLSAVGLNGVAVTPHPAIVVNFRSFSTGCGKPELCVAQVSDSTLQQGQGMHGGFGRGDTANFMAAIGPDFKQRFVDTAPVSNADVGATLAHLLNLDITSVGKLRGRVLTEALKDGKPVHSVRRTLSSPTAEDGHQTLLIEQSVGDTMYFDAAGFKGKTVGLQPGRDKRAVH